ncbi:MAG: exodeoxyribonuclease V subunit alpha [Proteobacteria bacterium]|nr:MAG: exodeoxyribonuclease V subunit alpha [Pseudomonadota bacterium]
MANAFPLNALTEQGFLEDQLARLMVRLCQNAGIQLTPEQQIALEQLARHASLSTRQGIIAARLPDSINLAVLPSDLPALGQAGEYKPLIIENGYIWLNRYWHYEQRLADNIRARLHPLTLSNLQQERIETVLDDWFPYADTLLQRQAVAQAAKSPFLIISGGPGTGKTSTVTRLLCLLIEQLDIAPQRIRLAAPTGKAAMRLQEAIQQTKRSLNLSPELAEKIPEQGSTLHRLLGYLPGRTHFAHHAHHPIPADVVIVDEASMIDISLMTHLFEAVRLDARLILLGDKDQLASVETGSIFRDLCARHSKRKHPLDQFTVVLQKSWRFSADSGIGQLARAILQQQEAKVLKLLKQPPADLVWNSKAVLDKHYLEHAWADYLKAVKNWPAQATEQAEQPTDLAALTGLFKAFNHFRILTPLRQGNLGTEQINQTLSRLLAEALGNANKRQALWYAGRPVMVTKNDYRQHLFNGDIGITLADTQGQLRVWFAHPATGSFRAIAPVRLPQHETTWAMTIHKSQGSEFEHVLMLLPESAESRLLVRELIYTGITRARQRLDVMGKDHVLLTAIRRSLPDTSRIRERLRY